MLEHIMIDWRDVLDIAIVAFLLYQIIQLLRGSRALAIVTGLGILTFLYFFSRTMGLYTLNWLLQHVFSSLFLVIVVIFQEDIRRALGEMGTKHFFHRSALKASAVEEVVSACEDMANAYIGALIVIERNMHLDDMIQREGVLVDARISSKLLKNIFYPASRRRRHPQSRPRDSRCLHSAPGRRQRTEFRHPSQGGPRYHRGK